MGVAIFVIVDRHDIDGILNILHVRPSALPRARAAFAADSRAVRARLASPLLASMSATIASSVAVMLAFKPRSLSMARVSTVR